MRNILTGFASVVMSSVALMSSAQADIIQDPLHAFCWGTTPMCTDNGTVTPTGRATPQFGFTISPGPQTGDFRVEVLLPNNDATVAGYSIKETQGGTGNTSTTTGSATLFSTTSWTSGNLSDYLSYTGASPTNALNAWLPSTQSLDAGATGYFVYNLDLGQTQLLDNPNGLSGPLLSLLSPALLPGSLIVGFLDTTDCSVSSCKGWVATASSGALFFSGTNHTSVPEPASLLVMGSALIGLGIRRRRNRRPDTHGAA